MEVYIEITYGVNALIILLVFEILCFLLNLQMTPKELCLYVFTYNISVIFLFTDLFIGFLLVYDLILTIVYFRRLVYIYYPLYIFIYFSIISFLEWLLPSSLIFQGVLLIEGFDFALMMTIAVFVILICYFYINYCQYHLHEDHFAEVRFQEQVWQGFIDNGNRVNYHGYPVIFINRQLFKDYQRIDTICIETASQKEWIDIVLLHEITINHLTLHHVYAGMMTSSAYDCILNKQLLGGLL